MKLLKEFVPTIVQAFNDSLLGDANCYHNFQYPRDNPNVREREDGKFKMQCMVGEDFFRVNHIEIHFHTNEFERHDNFWEYIKKELTSIG